tara:strand:+ start:620 stop:1111 length:492 start_codon:yes stop_codon:yes gene_type:complete
MNKAKQKGTAWETECVRYLSHVIFGNERGFRRSPLSGNKDTGDIESAWLPEFVFECKNRKDALSSLSEIMKETEQERINADADYGVALVKRRNFGTGGAYVVMELAHFASLLRTWMDMKERESRGGVNTLGYPLSPGVQERNAHVEHVVEDTGNQASGKASED